MSDSQFRRFIRLPRWPAEALGAISDAELLTRYTVQNDEAAFELLLRRHGPMVLAACRRMLSDPHDAEDAFQAAFLTLVRKGRSIVRREAVAGWLYRVACRAAARLRLDRARRIGQQSPEMENIAGPAVGNDSAFELWQVLDEEIERLPSRHRSAFVLCCLEGMTVAEAAEELGCPSGTVSSRLTRARHHLRVRLTHRGLAPAALASLAIIPLAGTAAPLIQSTLVAARAFALGRATDAAASRPMFIAEGVLKAMSTIKLKAVALLVALIALSSAGLLSHVMEAAPPVKDQPAKKRVEEANAPPVEDQPAKKRAEEANAPPTVTVAQPQKGGLDRVSDQPCTIESFQQVDLVAVASGFIKELKVDIGDKVKKGDVLVAIDSPALALDERLALNAVQQAKGLVRAAEVRIQAAKAEVDAAKGTVVLRHAEAAGAKAMLSFREKQMDRVRGLYKDNAVDARFLDESQQQAIAAKAAVDSAAAAVENAKAELQIKLVKVSQSEAALDTAKANVEAAEIGLEKARLAVAMTKLLAPFDGVVTRRNNLAGDYVFGGAVVRPVLTLQRMDLMRVVVQVPFWDAGLTEPGILAEVRFGGSPERRFAGKVSRVALAEDPQTRTMRAEIDLPNPDLRLRPGMSGRTRILLQKADPALLRVPRGAVVSLHDENDESVNGVYVVREGKAHWTPVRFGRTDEEQVEVLSGLKPEDRVVTDPKGLKGKTVTVEVREGP